MKTSKDLNSNILSEINEYLINRFHYKTSPAEFGMTNSTIVAHRKKFDLYFRLVEESGGLWGSNTFVIAKIAFQKEKSGHGTHLLRFLTGLVSKNGLKFVGIECTNENSSAFAKKFGFLPMDDQNYVTSVEDLVSHFQE